MSTEPRGALSRRHVIGTFVAGAAGLALPIGVAGQPAIAAGLDIVPAGLGTRAELLGALRLATTLALR
ncbi:hypothetical protein [Streptomyces sp. NPDC005262]|uniref:hypothetical protein n=1 Tax=Streptomyces sp. NPDC005262 TaxID=3364710 RepID=UPI0036A98622